MEEKEENPLVTLYIISNGGKGGKVKYKALGRPHAPQIVSNRRDNKM